MARSVSRFQGAAASAILTMALVALAYRFPATIEVDFGSPLEGALGSSGFHDAEGSYRWSRARSEIVFPDPGARNPVRLELVLSGFRPPGSEPPLVAIEAEGRTLSIAPSRRVETYSLETSTDGLWSSSSRIQIRSGTFVPGAGDDRSLGVRVHRARLVLDGPASPPLKQVLASGVVAALFALWIGTLGGSALGAVLGFGFLFFRFEAALITPPLAVVGLLLALGARFFPAVFRGAFDRSRRFGRSLLDGARALRGRAVFPLAAILTLATVAAFALRPRFELELGTGLPEPLLHRFAGFDRDEKGVVVRRTLPGASIDLRDFGAGAAWKVSIEASEAEARRLDLPAPPWGFRSGHVLRFPEPPAMRISSLSVDRGRSLPPLRVVGLVLVSWALFAGAFGACGLSPRMALSSGSALSGLTIAGIAASPVFFIPLLGRITLAASVSLLAAAAVRGISRKVSNAALAIATGAFALWFLASASPLYSGGHFGYHTSVAEEIWGGKFFLYYFPGPDNMLSHQPQWGNMTVPHPSLYHTVTAPLALLPRAWFHLATKLFLAFLLAGITLIVSAVARAAAETTGSDGERASVYAAGAAVAFPTSWQLLGLGHLMTIFGSFAAAAALGFVALVTTRLDERREWLIGLTLVTFAFLSYTGSLLFGSLALAFASAALRRSDSRIARSLLWLLLAGWLLALLLYYIHWVAPFFRETLPRMLSGAGSDPSIDWTARLGLLPEKLDYTFGAFWVPFAGLLGLSLAEGRPRRFVLYGWGLAIPLFCVLDLAFNFLLKHHYFSFPVVAVGFGLALRRLEEKGRLGMAVFLVVVVYLCVTGAGSVFRLATGAV